MSRKKIVFFIPFQYFVVIDKQITIYGSIQAEYLSVLSFLTFITSKKQVRRSHVYQKTSPGYRVALFWISISRVKFAQWGDGLIRTRWPPEEIAKQLLNTVAPLSKIRRSFQKLNSFR